VGYVGLEIDPIQLVARVGAFATRPQWSDVFTGRQPADRSAEAKAALARASELIYVEQPSSRGWPFQWLPQLAEQIRTDHPERRSPSGERVAGSRPMLLVVDFLQIVGDAAALRDGGRALEIRQRISEAMNVARDVAIRLDVAVVVISSAARDQYALLAGDLERVGLGRSTLADGTPCTTIDQPERLIGTGKESGDIEYAATTVTVAVRVPGPRENRVVVLATVKNRLGSHPAWTALAFDGSRFSEVDPSRVTLPGEKEAPAPAQRKNSTPQGARYSEDA
jgi:hypothetical protein